MKNENKVAIAIGLTKSLYLGKERKTDLSEDEVFETFKRFMTIIDESQTESLASHTKVSATKRR